MLFLLKKKKKRRILYGKACGIISGVWYFCKTEKTQRSQYSRLEEAVEDRA